MLLDMIDNFLLEISFVTFWHPFPGFPLQLLAILGSFYDIEGIRIIVTSKHLKGQLGPRE